MAELRKILGQSNPSASVLTDLYTVPVGTQAIVSTLLVCNMGNTAAVFRVSFANAGQADDPKQYGYYNVTIPIGETFAATLGMTLYATDIVRCFASTSNLAIQIFGIEIT